jgi:TonB family protein
MSRQQKTLSRKLIPNQESWFDANDYPTSMLRSGEQGIVNFRLRVDRAGKPTECKVQESTRPKAFDDAVCKTVMRRAKFEPALDAHGNLAPSYWRQTVIFRICC